MVEPAHKRVLAYLRLSIGKPAPRNKEIFEAVGLTVSSSHTMFKRLENSGFLTIERTSKARRFLFSDGKKTDWGSNAQNCKGHKVPLKPRRARSDESAKTAIETYWKERGLTVKVVIERSGILRAYHSDGTPLKFGMPAASVDNVPRETGVRNA